MSGLVVAMLNERLMREPLVINSVIVSVSVRYESMNDLDSATGGFVPTFMHCLGRASGRFLAGKCFATIVP